MLKYLFALIVSASIIAGSICLFHNRKWLFRPNVERTGGTELVFAVDGDPPGDEQAGLVAVLERRFDPSGTLGIVVAAEEGQISIKVPAGRRHDELVDLVKAVAGRAGQLELCILANRMDDTDACNAALTQLKGLPGAGRADRPPEPRNKAGKPEFETTPPPRPAHRYRWARLTESATKGVQLHGLKGGGSPIDRPLVEQCLRTGEPFSPNLLQQCLVYALQPAGATDPTFFVLTRDPGPETRVTAGMIEQVRVHADRRRGLHLRFSREGAQYLLQLTGPNVSHHIRRAGEYRYLGIFLDGELLGVQMLIATVLRDLFITGDFTKEELEGIAAIIRGGPLPVRLQPKPIRQTTIDPR